VLQGLQRQLHLPVVELEDLSKTRFLVLGEAAEKLLE
jgi:hypothetical protein